MERRILDSSQIEGFSSYLIREEKTIATCSKYLRDVRHFRSYAGSTPITKELVAQWKKHLAHQNYTVRSINSMLASVNSFLTFLGWHDCKVKCIRLQRQTYCAEDRELTKSEYMRLLEAAGRDEQLRLVLQTICSTGIRVSELQYFTVEAVRRGMVTVSCKSKTRTIMVPGRLKTILLNFARQHRIRHGAIFIGRSGTPLDRSSIWRKMKRLCHTAGVKPTKVFPHNLRKLFARTFYGLEKDIAKLADLLGHSSINTTRIYIMSTGLEHRRKIEQLGLII